MDLLDVEVAVIVDAAEVAVIVTDEVEVEEEEEDVVEVVAVVVAEEVEAEEEEVQSLRKAHRTRRESTRRCRSL